MSMDKEDTLFLNTINDGIQKITLNRPSKRNAINPQMYTSLTKIITHSAKNEKVFALVITGNGEYYSSGNDLSLSSKTNENESPDIFNTLKIIKEFIDALILYPKLLIAVVNGPALGIAVTTLALCDIVYASEKATFVTPFSKIGFTAEGCSTYTFPRILGTSKAGDMLYLNYKMNAQEAKECGLVSKLFKPEDIDKIWWELSQIKELSAESILRTKKLLRGWDKDILLRVNVEETRILTDTVISDKFIERMFNYINHKSKL